MNDEIKNKKVVGELPKFAVPNGDMIKKQKVIEAIDSQIRLTQRLGECDECEMRLNDLKKELGLK